MDSNTILSITKCGDLFPYGEAEVKERYKELAKDWHPDINASPEAPDVFAKITELYNRALMLLADGQWEKSNYILIHKADDRKIALNFDTQFRFEIGTCYVTKTKVVYILDSDKEKYYKNAIQKINHLHYGDKKMQDDLGRFLPQIYQTFKTSDEKYVLVLNKTEDVYPLRTMFEYFNRQPDDRHVAWIISRLCNLTCYLQFIGLVHNGINMDNCFLSPHNHSVLLLGGWWYATKENETMLGTTKDIFSVMPITAKSSKKSSVITDLESVKLLGRQLLGETNCRRLALYGTVPKPFINFLIGGSGSNSYEEFAKWDKALIDSYGKRKFINMEIKNIYERKGD